MTLEVCHTLAGGRELRFSSRCRAQTKSMGNERCAIQAQPVDEELSFGGQSNQTRCRILANMGGEIIATRVQ